MFGIVLGLMLIVRAHMADPTLLTSQAAGLMIAGGMVLGFVLGGAVGSD